MFSGIIQCIGAVNEARKTRDGALKLWIQTGFKSLSQGESVAVDGVCLTVTGKRKMKKGMIFSADVSEETLRRTSLSSLQKGDAVNLERSLRLSDRIGGHFVQGHVDATGKVLSVRSEGASKRYAFSYPDALAPYLVMKGSVAVNGISLTVASLDKRSFSAAIVPFTEKNTNLGRKRPGDAVNLEADFIAKVIARQAGPYRETGTLSGDLYQKKTVSWDDLMKEDGLT